MARLTFTNQLFAMLQSRAQENACKFVPSTQPYYTLAQSMVEVKSDQAKREN